MVRLPSRQDLAVLASTLGPMTLIYLCKNLTYMQLSVRLRAFRATAFLLVVECCTL